MSRTRPPLMFGFIAKPRGGKSYILVQIILKKLANGERVLVVDPDGAEDIWNNPKFKRYNDIKDVPDHFKGVAVVMHSEKEYDGTPTFPYLQKKIDMRNNGGQRGPWSGITVVLDDANVYAGERVEDALDWLLKRKRQYGIDIFTTAHTWGEVCRKFLKYVNVYGIGITDGVPSERSDVLKGEALKKTEAWREKVNAVHRSGKNPHPWVFITAQGNAYRGEI